LKTTASSSPGRVSTSGGLDACSYLSLADGLAYIVIGDDTTSAVRERLDALHELAHLLLHHSVDTRAMTAKRANKAAEAQAFRMASAIALPEKSFLADLWAPTLDAFASLKPRWKVSIGAMIHRCADLGLVNAEQAQRLWINYARRG
jgi:Zn-dependent peptidase ImmA (M78 family)